jgi:hypothetical protein
LTSIEIAFLCAIFALYLSECLHWVGSSEQAFTRLSAREWKTWRIEPLSFTLAGRTPVLAAPFLLRPGFVRTPLTNVDPDRTLRKVARRLDRMVLLLTLCRVQAVLLLIYLPLLIVLHRLASVWPVFLSALLVVHVALSIIAIQALRRSKATSWLTAAGSIALNPLGATRALDLLAQNFFDADQKDGQNSHRKPIASSPH